jgi:hypothetical protein
MERETKFSDLYHNILQAISQKVDPKDLGNWVRVNQAIRNAVNPEGRFRDVPNDILGEILSYLDKDTQAKFASTGLSIQKRTDIYRKKPLIEEMKKYAKNQLVLDTLEKLSYDKLLIFKDFMLNPYFIYLDPEQQIKYIKNVKNYLSLDSVYEEPVHNIFHTDRFKADEINYELSGYINGNKITRGEIVDFILDMIEHYTYEPVSFKVAEKLNTLTLNQLKLFYNRFINEYFMDLSNQDKIDYIDFVFSEPKYARGEMVYNDYIPYVFWRFSDEINPLNLWNKKVPRWDNEQY